MMMKQKMKVRQKEGKHATDRAKLGIKKKERRASGDNEDNVVL